MEDVLEVYEREIDPQAPLVCLDEFCKQLVSDARPAQPCAPGQPARQDGEYIRHGSASVFVMTAPLEGRREIYIGPEGCRKACDYAHALDFIATKMFPSARKIVLVEDNLNTHGDSSLYSTFPPEKARELAARFERHHTPKHGSWLNIAETEISALVRTGIPERVCSLDQLRRTLDAVVKRRNLATVTTNWQFTNDNARIKLRTLYPSVLI